MAAQIHHARPTSQSLFKIWFWTVVAFSGVLVAACWSLPFVADWLPRPLRFYDQILMDWSTPVILVLFVTSCAGWRSNRRLAIAGILLGVVWLVYREWPRL